MFSGVQNYIALIGKSDDPHRKEKVGRFGELLVLEATQMGLATFWVAGTWEYGSPSSFHPSPSSEEGAQ